MPDASILHGTARPDVSSSAKVTVQQKPALIAAAPVMGTDTYLYEEIFDLPLSDVSRQVADENHAPA